MKPFFLITGCGSSGTKYAMKIFRACGVRVTHEDRARNLDGLSSWYCGINKVFPRGQHGYRYTLPPFNAMTWDRFPKDRKTVVLHQTRNPLKTISTNQRFSAPSWHYVNLCLPDKVKLEDPLLLRCMKYWYYWNIEIEKIADFRYKVEEIVDTWPQICSIIERPELIEKIGEVKNMRKDVNSKISKYEPRTWDDLYEQDYELATKIHEIGTKYGYK